MTVSLWWKPLDEVQKEVAGTQPAPAGVASAAITAAIGLSLLIKVLRITGKRADLLPEAERVLEELRAAADDDVAAVFAYIRTRDTQGIQSVPPRAAQSVAQALEICQQASGAITGLIAADVQAATALLEGAAHAIAACIAANHKASSRP